MKLKHFLTSCTETNSKGIKGLNTRPETIKLLEENIGRTVCDINCRHTFLDLSPMAKEAKAKINKWDLIEKLLHSKGNH